MMTDPAGAQRGRGRHRRALVVAACAVAAWSLVGARPAEAAGDRAGDAVVVAADDREPVLRGDGTSPFSIVLPRGAACPGDTMEAQYRVQSFLAPVAVDPGSLVYQGVRPRAEGAWALYDTSTKTFMNAATDMAGEPGGEGPIINLPDFSFGVFEPGMVAPGRYHIGIACSLWTETERYWSTMIQVSVDEADHAGIAWVVLDAPEGAGADDDGSTIPLVVAAAVAMGAIAATVRARRRRADELEPREAP